MLGENCAPVCGPDLQRIDVSPTLTVVIGRGALPPSQLPPVAVALVYDWGGAGAPATLKIYEPLEAPKVLDADTTESGRLILLVGLASLIRIGGEAPLGEDRAGYHLSSELRTIMLAIRDCGLDGAALHTYRAAKSMELLCDTIRARRDRELIGLSADGALSLADTRRIVAARRMIDERWSEKLTLDEIARACGLNRAKLTRGFREMFDCTIAEVLAERRLTEASRLLVTTDLAVSSVGYQAGYLNNASFARAFSRRFGVCPSNYRSARLAA